MSQEPKDAKKWGTMGGPSRPPQFLQDQAANLAKIRDLLEGAVAQKQAEVRALQEKLIRIQHGGGS